MIGFTISEVRGNSDGSIQPDELVELTVAPTGVINPGDRFTIELQYGGGPVTLSSHTLPPVVDA